MLVNNDRAPDRAPREITKRLDLPLMRGYVERIARVFNGTVVQFAELETALLCFYCDVSRGIQEGYPEETRQMRAALVAQMGSTAMAGLVMKVHKMTDAEVRAAVTPASSC